MGQPSQGGIYDHWHLCCCVRIRSDFRERDRASTSRETFPRQWLALQYGSCRAEVLSQRAFSLFKPWRLRTFVRHTLERFGRFLNCPLTLVKMACVTLGRHLNVSEGGVALKDCVVLKILDCPLCARHRINYITVRYNFECHQRLTGFHPVNLPWGVCLSSTVFPPCLHNVQY